jgi:Ni/Co efflux regulator RcnB
MKKFIMTALAATLTLSPLAVTAAEAAPQHRETTTVKYKNNGHKVVKTRTVVKQTNRTWRQGERFDRRHATNYRTVTNYRTYRLHAPARGQHWVRSGRDALLLNGNGTIIRVQTRAF